MGCTPVVAGLVKLKLNKDVDLVVGKFSAIVFVADVVVVVLTVPDVVGCVEDVLVVIGSAVLGSTIEVLTIPDVVCCLEVFLVVDCAVLD